MDSKINSEIPEWHVWDLRKAAAEFLVPRLTLFRDWVKAGKMMALPIWVREEIDDVRDEDLNNAWAGILNEIIEGFVLFSNNYEFEIDNDELVYKKERALYLLSKFYYHLWD